MAAADAPRPRIAPLTAPPEVVLPGAQPSQPALFAMEIAPTPPPNRTADSGKESPAGKRQAGKNGRQPAEARPAAAGSVEEMVGDFLNACRRPDQTNPEYVIPYSLNQGEERAAARKLLDDGWTSAQVVQCLYYLKGLRDRNGDPLYTTHINLWTIRKQIGAWFAKQNKAQRQAAKRQEDEIVPLVQRAAR